MAPRGSLIAIEGGDKAGKSTCSQLLEEVLRNSGVDVTLIQFPNRVSQTGKIIDAYLKGIFNCMTRPFIDLCSKSVGRV